MIVTADKWGSQKTCVDLSLFLEPDHLQWGWLNKEPTGTGELGPQIEGRGEERRGEDTCVTAITKK